METQSSNIGVEWIRSNKTSIKHSIAYVWSRLPWQPILSHRSPLSLLSSVAHCSWFSFLTQRAWSPWQARRTCHPLHTTNNTNTNQHLRVTRVRNSISRLGWVLFSDSHSRVLYGEEGDIFPNLRFPAAKLFTCCLTRL